MVEDVLTVVRKTEDEAEEIINKAKEEASQRLDKSDREARRMILDLEAAGKKEADEILKRAQIEGEKESRGIVDEELKKAEKLEKDSQKNIARGVKLIIDSVLKVGGE
jgi:vacuolar-type H+-ATPase subunit H